MTATVFVDTNVLLYAIDVTNPAKREMARSWREQLWLSRRGRVSVQVLQEFYANVIRKHPAARDQARAEILNLLAWRPVAMDTDILSLGWQLQDRFQLSFWDSLIVAAAKSSSCKFLLTEDLQSGQDLDGITVLDPFSAEPSAILSE